MLQIFSHCNITNKDHIIQRIILMEFTDSKSFSKHRLLRVSRCTSGYRSIYHGRTEFHEIAYCLLQCLQSLLGAASRIVARILQTLQTDVNVRNCIFAYFQSKLGTNLPQLNFLLLETVE